MKGLKKLVLLGVSTLALAGCFSENKISTKKPLVGVLDFAEQEKLK